MYGKQIKVNIFDHHNDCKEELSSRGYKQNAVYNLDQYYVTMLIFELYESGLNVMLSHQGEGLLLSVSKRGFGQR